MEVNTLLMEQVLHLLRENGIKATRGAIYYLEKKGLIHPFLVTAGARKKRFYSEDDYRLIAKAFRYTNMGLTVDAACEVLMNPPGEFLWFLVRTRSGMPFPFVNALKKYKEVKMAAAIWGSFYDVILKVGIWHRVDRDFLLFGEFPRWGGIAGAYQLYELKNLIFCKKEQGDVDQNTDLIEANTFIGVSESNKMELADRLSQYDQVLELAEIEGDMNFVIRVQGEDKRDLDHITMEIMKSSLAEKMKTYFSINQV